MLPFPEGDPFPSGTPLTTGNDAWFSGANAMSQNGGARVQLHTPSIGNEGSSYTHLATSFASGADSLMTAQYGLVAREPSPLTVAIMRDMGWPLQDSEPHVDVTGPLARPTGQSAIFSAVYHPTSTAGAIRYEWTFEGLSPQDHPDQGTSDTATATWISPGRKLVTVKASGPGTAVHSVFAVDVTSPATATPSPTASPTRTLTPSPSATPAARSLLPYVTRN
jgi:hypothetical protein